MSAWDFPKHDTHSVWASSAYRGVLHIVQWQSIICNNAALKCSLLWGAFRSSPDGGRGSTGSASWSLQEVQSSCWGVSTANLCIIEEPVRKGKGLCRWREVTNARSMPPLGHWFIFIAQHEPMDVQLHCVIKKGFSWRGKNSFFPYHVFDAVRVKYRKINYI